MGRSLGALLLMGGFILMSATWAGEPKTVVLAEKDHLSKTSLKKGDTLILRLDGNPTTGFTWVVGQNDKSVLPEQGKHKYVPQGNGKVGAGGVFEFKFKAEKAGKSDLVLEYKRPFEKDVAPAKIIKLSVDVR
jgi:inhibitor of cysteine peptidase